MAHSVRDRLRAVVPQRFHRRAYFLEGVLHASLWRLLRLLPGTSRCLGPPRALLDDRTKTTPPATDLRVWTPEPDEVPAPPPPTAADGGGVHWAFERNAQVRSEALAVRVVEGARVLADGVVVDRSDRVRASSIRTFGRPVTAEPVFAALRLPPLRRVRGGVAVISASASCNYYHWLFDCLPRFDLLQRYGEGWDWVVTDTALPFQRQSLATLGIPPAAVIENRPDLHIEAERVLLPTVPVRAAPWQAAFLRARYLPSVAAANALPRRLYLSRNRGGSRRLLNEDEVEPRLARLGFATVHLEGLSFSEQIQLFAEAEAIVAPHGAGLANIVFCRPGTRLLELFSPAYVNPLYYDVARASGVIYSYLIGRGRLVPPGEYETVRADITIDAAVFETAVHALLENL